MKSLFRREKSNSIFYKVYPQYVTKRFRLFLDGEEGLYLRRYFWNMKLYHEHFRRYTCEPFEFGWMGDREEMEDWSRWYTAYVAEKKPKNPILFWLHSAFIEPFDVEIFLYHDFLVARYHNEIISRDYAAGDYPSAAYFARSLEEDVDVYLSMYLFDVEHFVIGPYIIDYIFSCFFWDFILDWGLTAYVMFIDMRWAVITSWNFICIQAKALYAYILTLIG